MDRLKIQNIEETEKILRLSMKELEEEFYLIDPIVTVQSFSHKLEITQKSTYMGSEGFISRLIGLLSASDDGGMSYNLGLGRALRTAKNDGKITQFPFASKRVCNKGLLISSHLNWYDFGDWILQGEKPFLCEELLFGGIDVRRDFSKLSLSLKRQIAVQCAAQVLFDLKKNSIRTIENMKEELLNKELPFYNLLELFNLQINNYRSLRDWISEVYPVPKEKRKSRMHRNQNDVPLGPLVPIPGIVSNGGVNFRKLRFILICLTRILKSIGCTLQEVIDSQSVCLVSDPFPYFSCFIRRWIREAYFSNGSIFHL